MLTPLDVENKKFSKQMMNGYNAEEVDNFLEELGIDYAKKYKEVNELNRKIEEMSLEMEKYKTIESTLQNTLIMAQSTADEVKSVAKQQAEQMIEEAKVTAQKEVSALDQEVAYKKKTLDDLQKQFDIYKAKMESLLISQLELIKEINKDEN